jgi:hypothetical protein
MWVGLSDERTVCHLRLLLDLASSVILWSKCRGNHDHIILSQIRDSPNLRAKSPYLYPPESGWPTYATGTGFPFRLLLRFPGIRWRYSNPSSRGVTGTGHGSSSALYSLEMDRTENISSNSSSIFALRSYRHRLRREHRFPRLLHCSVRVCWGYHVIAIEPLLSNGRCFQSHSLATAVSAGLTFLAVSKYVIYTKMVKLRFNVINT